MANQTATLAGVGPETVLAAPKDKKNKKEKPRPSRKRLLVLVLALVVAAAAAAYFLLPKGEPAAEVPQQGPVLKLESITLNLAEGHFLKLGLALEFKPAEGGHGAGEEHDGSKALDLAISQFSNLKLTDLNSTEARTKAKARLTKAIQREYHGTVKAVYFTEFVMQ